jgi:Transglycosylase SLT domain
VLSGADGLLRIRSAARGRVATAIGTQCLVLLDWTGFVETDQRAELDAGRPRVRFRTVDSRLLDDDGEPATFTGVIWGWVSDYVHPKLDTLTVDLEAPLAEIQSLLPLMLTSGDAERTRGIIDSLALTGVTVEADAVTLGARIAIPEVARTPSIPEPVLTQEELAQWQQAWQQWDAFLTFVIKASARDSTRDATRGALLDVLLSARYDIVEILAATPQGPDPVPALFVRTWDRLAPVLREMQTGLPGETALQYLSFIAAADALKGIQGLGPGAGLDLSADGLRRMARIIAPATADDPLTRSFEVDPELRSLMGFGPAIAPPQGGGGASWIDGILRAARAIERIDPLLVVKLNLWVPDYKNAKGYLPLVEELLEQTSALTMAKGKVPAKHAQLFHDLLLATAWKESCWRQYVREKGVVKTIESVTGALGMMQVAPNAWRGFYDIANLTEDIGYNARAGAEILAHYLTRYAIRKREDKYGIPDALARATYAVYNGGPSHRRRYRLKSTKKSLRAIDKSFYKKYLSIKAGKTREVMTCYLG